MEVNCEPGPSNLTSPFKKHVRGKGFTSGEKIQIVDNSMGEVADVVINFGSDDSSDSN